MTPREIITKEVQRIPNIRIPLAALVVGRIFDKFEEYGYTVIERQPAAGNVSHEKRIDNR
jgi:hypothetical protein